MVGRSSDGRVFLYIDLSAAGLRVTAASQQLASRVISIEHRGVYWKRFGFWVCKLATLLFGSAV
jgi:hypothetical protein